MNTRLLILGVLHRGDFHPYEIKRRLEAAMVECYMNVDVGTLYYAVRQLEKEGLISSVAEERVARGGMRTVYRVTPGGAIRISRGPAPAIRGGGTGLADALWRASVPASGRSAPLSRTASAAG